MTQASPIIEQSIPPLRDSLSSPRRIAVVALIGLLLIVLVGLQPLAAPGTFNPLLMPETSSLKRAAFLCAFGLALIAAITGRIRVALAVPVSVLLLLAWCAVSASWSIAPAITWRRVILLSIVIATIFFTVNVLGARAIRIMGLVLAAIVVGDWLSILLSKNAVHLPGELDPTLIGKWHGLHGHKNTAGLIMALASLMFLFCPPTRSRVLQALLIFLATVFLIFTGSKTAQAAFCISALVGFVYYPRGPLGANFRTVMLFTLTAVSIFLISLMVAYLTSGASLLSDDTLFAGRALIWKQVLQLASQRPLFGYGYGSFWSTGELSPMMSYYYSWAFRINSTHNGYVDVFASVGMVGLILAVVVLFVVPSIRLMRSHSLEPGIRALLLSWIAFCAVENLMESFMLAVNSLSIVHFFALALQSRVEPRDGRFGVDTKMVVEVNE